MAAYHPIRWAHCKKQTIQETHNVFIHFHQYFINKTMCNFVTWYDEHTHNEIAKDIRVCKLTLEQFQWSGMPVCLHKDGTRISVISACMINATTTNGTDSCNLCSLSFCKNPFPNWIISQGCHWQLRTEWKILQKHSQEEHT